MDQAAFPLLVFTNKISEGVKCALRRQKSFNKTSAEPFLPCKAYRCHLTMVPLMLKTIEFVARSRAIKYEGRKTSPVLNSYANKSSFGSDKYSMTLRASECLRVALVNMPLLFPMKVSPFQPSVTVPSLGYCLFVNSYASDICHLILGPFFFHSVLPFALPPPPQPD
jgi:hypothetical protein